MESVRTYTTNNEWVWWVSSLIVVGIIGYIAYSYGYEAHKEISSGEWTKGYEVGLSANTESVTETVYNSGYDEGYAAGLAENKAVVHLGLRSGLSRLLQICINI